MTNVTATASVLSEMENFLVSIEDVTTETLSRVSAYLRKAESGILAVIDETTTLANNEERERAIEERATLTDKLQRIHVRLLHLVSSEEQKRQN